MKTEQLLFFFDSRDIALGVSDPRRTSEKSMPVLEACGHLKKNHIIGLPSDTIYGLFTPLFSGDLIRLHEIKERGLDHPFLVLLPENYDIDRLVDFDGMPPAAKTRMKEFWPGRVSLVMKKRGSLVYPPGGTIGLRVPRMEDNLFFYRVLEAFGEPLVGPSLNLHGKPPLEDPQEMACDFSGKADRIFFDRSFVPVEASQIWDLTQEPFCRLR